MTIMTTAVSVILARSLAAKDFGLFSGFLGLSQAFSLAIDVGLSTWLLRELSVVSARSSDSDADGLGLVRDTLWVMRRSGGCLVIVVAASVAALGLNLSLIALATGLMLYVVLIAMATALETSLRARRLLRMVVFSNAVEKVSLITGVAIVVLAGFGLGGIAVAYVVAGIARFGVDSRLAFGGTAGSRSVSRVRAGSLIKAAAPFALNATAFSFVPRLDLPLITLISATAAGYFAIGYQITTTLVLLPVIGASTLYPFLARRSHGISIQRLALGFGLAGLCTAAVAIAVTPLLVPPVFGSKYQAAVTPTQIMILALPPIFYANGLLAGVYTEQREHQLMRRTLPSAVIGTAAVVAGQALVGVNGAAAGYVLRNILFAFALLSMRSVRRGRQTVGATGVKSVLESHGAGAQNRSQAETRRSR